MNKIYYDKLVRDHIPEIIESSGRAYEVREVEEDEFIDLLKAKLVEEALEVQQSSPQDLVVELADLKEVLDYILRAYELGENDVESTQQARRKTRGGFDRKYKLVWAEG